MHTAAQAVAAWESHGNLAAELRIQDVSITCLPALPAGLQRLDCSGCLALCSLFAVSELHSLLTLNCSQCPVLRSLPAVLPAGLTLLACSGCLALCALPTTLPAGLLTLCCSACPALCSLSAALELCFLRYLYCSHCPRLRFLPALPSLVVLSWCRALCSLPAAAHLRSLTHLYCTECPRLRFLPELPSLLVLCSSSSTRLPHSCPVYVQLNLVLRPDSRAAWRWCVAGQHALDRGIAAAALPAAALQFV